MFFFLRHDFQFCPRCPAGGLDLEKYCFFNLLLPSKCPNTIIWLDLSIRSMLGLLVLKEYAECTSQHVKRTSGARDLTISFRQLSGPKTLKLPDLNIVFYTISFRNVPGRKFLKQSEGQKLLNSRGPAPDCFSAFPVHSSQGWTQTQLIDDHNFS